MFRVLYCKDVGLNKVDNIGCDFGMGWNWYEAFKLNCDCLFIELKWWNR